MKVLSSVLIVVALAQASPLKEGPSSQPDKESVLCGVKDSCSLRGKPAVQVAVGLAVHNGGTLLWKTQLKTDIELELRRHGIKVVENSLGKVINLTELFVSVNAMSFDEDRRFAYHVGMSGLQVVRLARNPDVMVYGTTTWSANGGIGISSSGGLQKVISEIVRDLTRQFANAYLTANPREKLGE